MPKILITPIGGGNINKKYDKAKYKFENSEMIIESEFIIEALSEKINPDKIIILGTAKSCWNKLYQYFATKKNKFDNEYNDYLIKFIENNGYSTNSKEFNSFNTKKLTDVFDCEVKIILIKYGLNQLELIENFEIMKNIENTFDITEKNKIYFDITHSFRSLPIYQFLYINYFTRVSNYVADIEAVYYGMFEAKNELDGVTKIIDLNILNELLEWINAINEFKNQGSIKTLVKLLKRNTKEILSNFALNLESFDNALNNNNLSQIKEELFKILDGYKNFSIHEKHKGPESIMIPVLYKSLTDSFSNHIDKDHYFQYNLAKWFYEQNRLGFASITICESIKSFFVYCNSGKNEIHNFKNEKNRSILYNRVKNNIDKLKNTGYNIEDLKLINDLMENYKVIYKFRNTAAHNGKNPKEKFSYGEENKLLKDYLNLVLECFNSKNVIKIIKEKLLVNDKTNDQNNKIKNILVIPKSKITSGTNQDIIKGQYINSRFVFLSKEIEYLWNLQENKEKTRKNCNEIINYITKNYNQCDTIVAIGVGRPLIISQIIKKLNEKNYKIFDYAIISSFDEHLKKIVEVHSISEISENKNNKDGEM